MNRAEVLTAIIRIEADLTKLREALQADLKADQPTQPEEFRAEEATRPQSETGEAATPKQLGMIRALARGAGVDADAECFEVFGYKTERLTKRAASSLIDHLKLTQLQARPA